MSERKPSTHRVEVIRINEIEKHPNADSLGIVRVFGYCCCVRLSDFKVGDLAAYIPPDSVVPNTPEFAFLGGHNRIRVKRLRGLFSQGLLVHAPPGSEPFDDVAEKLGIVRYEPPLPLSSGGEAEIGPRFFCPKYDVESWHRYKHLLVPGEEVIVTEKIHGASARYVWHEDRLYCGSRNEWKRVNSGNLWWAAATNCPWLMEWVTKNPQFVLYGEVYGRVQDLTYGASTADKPWFRAFDVFQWSDGTWRRDVFDRDIPPGVKVPVLYRGPYDEKLVRELSLGKSVLADHLKEGVVVEPVTPRYSDEAGRVKFKIVSDEYLERS